ncbi:MAG TPA: tRNA (N6-threonylcarbamoyladenosine(37)-N6)-methyltransferase TrmO [Steroidobacteraceae bacterium]|jgi:tRNA-Thr(GGU) m(6)t(6)A37 methyltransferase TsaA
MSTFEITSIGAVSSSLATLEAAPRQADEGAPEAWLVFDPEVIPALRNVRVGDDLVLITWLDRARRDVLTVHPRGDVSRPAEGVFSTRSPHRPNPLGLHDVHVTAVEGSRLRVHGLEAIDGTPIVDVKPVLSANIAQR